MTTISVQQAIEVIKAAPNDIVIGLVGPPGVGKDAAFIQAAQQQGWEYWNRYVAVMEIVEINGCPTVNRETERAAWAPFDGVFPLARDADRYGGKTIQVVLSDIGQAAPAVQKAVVRAGYGDGHTRAVGVHPLYQKTRIGFTSNLHTHRAGAHRFESYFSNRVTVLEIQPDPLEWVHWYLENDGHPLVAAFVRWTKEVTDFKPEKDSFMSPRSLVRLGEWLKACQTAEIKDAAVQAIVYGTIGPEAGSKFQAYAALATELPDMDAVLAGHKVQLPTRPEVQYMFATTLLTAARPEHAPIVARIILELTDGAGSGLEVAAFITMEAIKGAATNLRGLASQPELYEWISKYGRYLP